MVDDRITDKVRLGQELDDLDHEAIADTQEGTLSTREVAEFQAVVAAIQAVFEEAEVARMSEELTPALHAVLDDAKVQRALTLLTPAQREAVEMLFTAASARDADRGTYVSASERSFLLNQALMHLHPVLSLALRPDFRGGRTVYRDLVAQLNIVRKDITAAELAEEAPEELAGLDRMDENHGGIPDPDVDASIEADASVEADASAEADASVEADASAEADAEASEEASAGPAEEIPAEPVEEAPAEPVEDASAELVEEAPAEPVEVIAELEVEAVEEAPAEPVEDASAEPVEQNTIEPVEEAPAEPVEVIAEPEIEAVEEAPTEPVEEKAVEPSAGPVEDAPAEPVPPGDSAGQMDEHGNSALDPIPRAARKPPARPGRGKPKR